MGTLKGEQIVAIEMGDRPCAGKWLSHRYNSDDGRCDDCGSLRPIHVRWNHIDGPMMSRPNGTLKWLTWRERFMHWIGAWSLEDIAKRPSL